MRDKRVLWWMLLGFLLVSLAAVQVLPAYAESTPVSVAVQEQERQVDDESTADHTKFEILKQDFKNAVEVTKACLSCHTEAAKQVMATYHWTWERTDLPTGKKVGKKVVINNFCVAVVSNWRRCTSCHAGYGWKDANFDFTNEELVDCLVCHDTTGKYKKFPPGAGHPVYEPKEFPPGSGKIWEPPNLSEIAQHVGPTSRNTCGACHFYGGGGDGVKHGDMDSTLKAPPKEVDVHMSPEGANLVCSDCHYKGTHRISGSRYHVTAKDPHGKDLPVPDENPATCESCHGLAPMKDAKLNDHVDKVACQTCHIPAFARGDKPTKMWWDWSKAGDKERGVEKDENGWVTYDPKKGEFIWAKNVTPTYLWFNGKMDVMTLGEKIDPTQEVYINKPHGSPDDPESRIYPFKVFRGKQGYDPVNKVLLVPHLMPYNEEDKTAFWASFKWGPAFEEGMKAAGLSYSGKYDWVETTMYWPITHMVAPKEKALQCGDCHTKGGRLEGVPGVYIPGRDRVAWLDTVGWTLTGLALLGVIIHGGMRIATASRKK